MSSRYLITLPKTYVFMEKKRIFPEKKSISGNIAKICGIQVKSMMTTLFFTKTQLPKNHQLTDNKSMSFLV